MLSAPTDHPLNLFMQSVLTYGSYLVTAVLLVIAIVMGVRQKTPFYVLLIVAAFIGAFAEPLYDVGMSLWFYTPGLWTTFTAYGIPQPVWAHSGYVVLYAGPAMFICDRIAKGLTATGLYQWAAIEASTSTGVRTRSASSTTRWQSACWRPRRWSVWPWLHPNCAVARPATGSCSACW